MKKNLLLLVGLLAAGVAFGSSVSTTLVDDPALAYDRTYDLDVNEVEFDRVSAQIVVSSAVTPAKTFTDGSVSTGQITVADPDALGATPSTNTITVADTADLAAAFATNSITVLSTTTLDGRDITFRGKIYREGRDWFKSTTATGTAVNLAAALTSATGIDASAGNGVVSATATRAGFYENSYTLTSNTTNLVVLNPTFTGGLDPALRNSFVTINGKKLREGLEWKEQATSSDTATAIAAILDKVSGVDASASGSVVFATAAAAGAAGNDFTLEGSTAALAAGGATFSGGRDAATVTIGGVSLVANVDWTATDTATGTAKAISDAIQANAALAAAISSTWTAQGVVAATSTAVGNVNYTLASNTPGLTVSGAAMAGGTSSAYAINTDRITIAAHGFTLGLPVLLTTTTALSPLSGGTTYYAAPIDANTIALATSSARAQAGQYVTFTSSSLAGPHTFTLTPLAYAGTPVLKFQASDDGIEFNDVQTATGTITYASPSITPTSYLYDLGEFNHRYLRLNVTAPTAGGLKLRVTVNGRKE